MRVGHLELPAPGGADVVPRGYYVALAALGLAFSLLCLKLAGHEYFKFDDWHFLNVVQKEGFSWGRSFLPIGTHRYWAIRPLGEQAYFRLGFQAFGLDATGYLLVSLAVHFAGGLVVFRVARLLGVARPVAVVTGMLAVTRNPSMAMIWSGCGFAYMLSQLCVSIAVMLFVDGTKRQSHARMGGSVLALAAALLSHEASIVIPAVLFGFALVLDRSGTALERTLRAVWRVVPHGVLVAAYLIVRFGVLAPLDPSRSNYTMNPNPLVAAQRYWIQLGELVGGTAVLSLTLVVIAVLVWWIARTDAGRSLLIGYWLPLAAVCLLWTAMALGPMLLLSAKAIRFSVHIEVPACLLVGTLLHVAWLRARTEPRRRAMAAALVVLVAVCLPWWPVYARLADDSRQFPRQIRRVLQDGADRVPVGSDIIFLYDGTGGPTWDDMQRFRSVSYGHDSMVSAMLPDKGTQVRTHNVQWTPDADTLCRDCIYLLLHPDLTTTFAEDEEIMQLIIKPAMAAHDAEIVRLGGAKLFDLRGRAALEQLERHCALRRAVEEPSACLKGFGAKIIRRGTADARYVARRLRGPARRGAKPQPGP